MEPLLTTPEVGKLLRMTPKGVRDLIAAGKLRAVRVGRSYRIERTALDEFVRTNRTTPTHNEGGGNG